MVKVLHTADWHIGKLLHKYSLEDDHKLFFDWLFDTIQNRDIDLLLVSGDVFDTAFPSNVSLGMYYKFLTRLVNHKCRIVITGGNHDSAGVLNAPRDILAHLTINVIGDVEGFPDAGYFAFPDWKISVAAIPFLRDSDLRRAASGLSYDDRIMLIRDGITRYYKDMVEFHQANFPENSLIGMGHLFVAGAEISESERDIHVVGNLAAFGGAQFPEGYDYIALGHIHKPQKITENIRYSGSPIPLSFSERSDPKYVIELAFDNGKLVHSETISTPILRELRSFSGNLDEVWAQLAAYQPGTVLEPLIEINIVEETYDPAKSLRFEMLLREFDHAPFRIIKPRLTFLNRLKDASELFVLGTEIADLSPKQVFQKRMEKETLDEEVRKILVEAFDELLSTVATADN